MNSSPRPDNCWITKRKAMEAFGMTPGEMRSKINRKWTEGVHWAIIDGRVWINWREVDEWLACEASGRGAVKYKSATSVTKSDTRKRSTSGRLKLI